MTDANEIGALLPGHRNDGLTRLGGAMRRKGSSLAEIEAALFEHNNRRCKPPLTGADVSRIAASVASYPIGGPDPLDAAWQAVSAQPCESNFDRFIALACQLQAARPGQAVALPLERIGKLMRLDWTTVRHYRQAAVRDGLLEVVSKHVPNRRAGLFRVALSSKGQEIPLGEAPSGIPTSYVNSSFSNGLVGISAKAPSGNEQEAPSGNGGDTMEPNEREAQVLRLAARGFRLFPCRPASKVPQIKAWQKAATCDVAQLSKWFEKFNDCNWALATGEESGVWVLDVDGDAAGAAMMRRFRERGYIGPETLCVVTGRHRGYHLYFSYPKGATIANKKGIPDWHEDLDVRGEGGYAMVPPSIWTDDPEKAQTEGREMRLSRPYTFLQGDGCVIAEAPAWLLAAIGVMSFAEIMTGPVAQHQAGGTA